MGIVIQHEFNEYAVKVQIKGHKSTSLKAKYSCPESPSEGSLKGLYNYIHIVPALEKLANCLIDAKNDMRAPVESFSTELFKQLSEQSIEAPKAKLLGMPLEKTDAQVILAKSTRAQNNPKSNDLKIRGETGAVEIDHSKFKAEEIVSGTTGCSNEKLGWSIRIRMPGLSNSENQAACTALVEQIKPQVENKVREQLAKGNALELAANAIQDVVRNQLPQSVQQAEVLVKLNRLELFNGTKVTISTKTTPSSLTHSVEKTPKNTEKTNSFSNFALTGHYQKI